MTRPAIELADVIRAFGPAFEEHHGGTLSPAQRQAMRAIVRCRTAALPTVARECEKIAARCAGANVDHLGYLLQVCELELIERERKAAERRLKAARFPAPKTLAEFDFTARPGVNKPLLLDLARGDYLTKRENILLVGPSGTGKTHLATALAMAACAQGKRVRFWRVTELITTLREAESVTCCGCVSSWRSSTCWCSTSSGTCRRARPARSCCSTSSGPRTSGRV